MIDRLPTIFGGEEASQGKSEDNKEMLLDQSDHMNHFGTTRIQKILF